MNIILSAGYLPSEPFANNNIEISLAQALSGMGNKCTVLGARDDALEDREYFSKKVKVIAKAFPPGYNKARMVYRDYSRDKTGFKKTFKAFALLHPVDAMRVFLFERRKTGWYGDIFRSTRERENADAVIAFCYPFEMAKAVILRDTRLLKIYYQLDPYGLHETLNVGKKDSKISEEQAVMDKAVRVITTKLLKKQYLSRRDYSKYREKIFDFDFPTLIPPDTGRESVFDFDENYINVLFCGTIDDSFRSPLFLIKALEPFFTGENPVRLYFLGAGESDTLKIYAGEYPRSIFVHPPVRHSIALSTMEKADVLVNIGNKISNMMPSKIFEYFSFGKPILNIQKAENCPAAEYFAKYPLSLTVPEYSESVPCRKIAAFLSSRRDKRLSYGEVAEIFPTATPEYAAGKIRAILSGQSGGEI